MFVPVVAVSGCLFCGVWGSCAKREGTFAAFSLMLFLVWHLLIVIDRHASSDQSPGPMLMWVHLGLFHGMSSYVFVTSCVCVTHDICIVLGSSLVFLAFLLCGDRKERVSYVFYHNTAHLAALFHMVPLMMFSICHLANGSITSEMRSLTTSNILCP